ncbi:hypothetical protein [Frankia sp. Cppng1_Ct_nod]|uniref:hypothetical protein n=1 Tax=Frankia sp. Cppng1_Ct_nod TaxID=2897162 RepID=UPI0010416F81|nr:hypothetical protein [Frankia sp. Cppng1_Ct_nod]
MSDWFRTIGDIEAAAGNAEELAAAMIGWLVEAGIVAADRTDCVLGSELGYPPGPNYADAMTEPDTTLGRLRTNGLEVITGRQVFDFGEGEVVNAGCPHCAATIRLIDDHWELDDRVWGPFGDAIHAWHGGAAGIVSCAVCAKPVELNDWRWNPEWGFGYLGFKFWNWPSLAPGFVTEFAGRLGHRVVCPASKL